ncbi:hypothetical protein [Streptoalloteichus hindustanus]|uniref:Uncharacterized protein n=1 Tax=Streptoalloteichus hindustanus TaxID=2017 RepID=A0A1M5MUT0_STRHI|nr:hypothetical protein [Streptoalloteichus hindustanus]SHG80937.1 hypothetical protein SAMN05444320_11456 [Streptoalloteichus hindustanus]
MRVELTGLSFTESGSIVEFRCSAGEGAGLWVSNDPPRVGGTCDVELDVEAEMASEVRLRSGGVAGLRLRGEHVVLSGQLRVLPEEAVYLEVGGSTVSVELPEDVDLPGESGDLVELTVARTVVRLFPHNL